jgi:hypothetical protein
MRTQLTRWAAALTVVLAGSLAARPAAAQISVVVSATSTYKPSEQDIVALFTGLKTTWADGTRVTLVDQADTPVGQKFYDDFLRQPATRVRKELTRLVFSGQALPPLRMDGSAAVKRAVAENTTRIGYIATSALDETVKEVLRIN